MDSEKVIDQKQKEKNEIITRVRKKRLEGIKKPSTIELAKIKENVDQLNKQNLKLVTSRKISLSILTDEEKKQYKNDLVEYKKNHKWEYKKSINFIINNIINKRKDNIDKLTLLERRKLTKQTIKLGHGGWTEILKNGHYHSTYDEFNIPRFKSEVEEYLKNKSIIKSK